MSSLWNSAEEYMRFMLRENSPKGLAKYFEVDDAHIYRAKNGDITPTLEKAIRQLDADSSYNRIPPPKPRTRIAADVTPAQRDRLHAIAARDGLTWSDYCRRLADDE